MVPSDTHLALRRCTRPATRTGWAKLTRMETVQLRRTRGAECVKWVGGVLLVGGGDNGGGGGHVVEFGRPPS